MGRGYVERRISSSIFQTVTIALCSDGVSAVGGSDTSLVRSVQQIIGSESAAGLECQTLLAWRCEV